MAGKPATPPSRLRERSGRTRRNAVLFGFPGAPTSLRRMQAPGILHPRIGRIALPALLLVALGGCPTPIPTCDDWRHYLPGIAIAEPGQRAESLVIGRLLLEGNGGNPVRIELSKLDGDTVVARTGLALAPDGRFAWGLARGTYVIARVDRFSDYEKGEYRIKASFHPHLRFEAKGTRYVGQAVAVLDPKLDDLLPAALFGPDTPRQGRLGVRSVTVSDALADELSRPSAPAALRSPGLETALMHAKPVAVYPVDTSQSCSRWQYLHWCIPFAICI
jgi:hypothetical protein